MKKTKIKKYTENYVSNFIDLLSNAKLTKIQEFYESRALLSKIRKNKKKILIFGNGGSSAIANHVTVDFVNVAKIKTLSINNSSIITCFANDYGFENWIKEAIKVYLNKGDALILISSSGESKNMINACNFAKKISENIITFTGFKKNNTLSKMGKINYWFDSKNYNHIENIHQFFLLALSDSFKSSDK